MRKARRISVVALAMVFILAFVSMTAYAATGTELGGNYKTVYRKSSNSTYYVTLDVTSMRADQHTDVRMLDISGNVVWEEYGAIDYSSSRRFVCGPNVCYIQARVGAKLISGEIGPKFAECYAYE